MRECRSVHSAQCTVCTTNPKTGSPDSSFNRVGDTMTDSMTDDGRCMLYL